MKKMYIEPKLETTSVSTTQGILTGSLLKSDTQVSGTSGGWTKEDNDWNIWEGETEE